MSVVFASNSPASDCAESTKRCNAGPKPPTAADVSSSSEAILSLGSAARPRSTASSIVPMSSGTVVRVMVCPGVK